MLDNPVRFHSDPSSNAPARHYPTIDRFWNDRPELRRLMEAFTTFYRYTQGKITGEPIAGGQEDKASEPLMNNIVVDNTTVVVVQ
jgi:hypothetical protein